MSVYRIKMNGKTYEIEVELIEKGQGKAASIDNKKREKAAPDNGKKPQKASEGAVVSTMPGSILEIVSAAGQKVSEGETVLVMETMKMENEISSPKDGTIKEIFVKEGQTVPVGEPLFELED